MTDHLRFPVCYHINPPPLNLSSRSHLHQHHHPGSCHVILRSHEALLSFLALLVCSDCRSLQGHLSQNHPRLTPSFFLPFFPSYVSCFSSFSSFCPSWTICGRLSHHRSLCRPWDHSIHRPLRLH